MRIAICDDEKRICTILAEKVGKFCPDAEIITYSSGKELLNADELPDILLLDIRMPEISGMDVAKTLRDRDWRKILIQVKNSFAGKLVLDPQTELPETSKDDKESHGYGLMNMKRITEKYYGTIQLEQREDMVIFTALLMIPE